MVERNIISLVHDQKFFWPNFEMIKASQNDHSSKNPTNVKFDDSVWRVGDSIWIHDDNVELQIKILAAAHCGMTGHRVQASSLSALREMFTWSNISEDTKNFIQNWIYCMALKSGLCIPRPLSITLHCHKR